MNCYGKVRDVLFIATWAIPLVALGQVESIAEGPMIPSQVQPQARQGVPYPSEKSGPENLPQDIPMEQKGFLPPSNPQEENKNSESYERVLNFWFGNLPNPAYFPDSRAMIWEGDNPEIYRQTLDVFGQELLKAQRGEYNSWRETPRGRLALIILLDRLPKILYRGRPQQYMSDRMAEALVIEGLQKGDDLRLYPIERAFFYLPLENAENLRMQDFAVSLYRRLLVEAPEDLKNVIADFLQQAVFSQNLIYQFGRFPQRNALMGRASTPQEIAYLNQGRSGGMVKNPEPMNKVREESKTSTK